MGAGAMQNAMQNPMGGQIPQLGTPIMGQMNSPMNSMNSQMNGIFLIFICFDLKIYAF